MQQAGKDYAAEVRDKPEEEHFSPHLHIFLAMLEALANDIKEKARKTDTAKAIIQFWEWAEEHSTPHTMGKYARICRLKSNYQKKGKKFTHRLHLRMEGTIDIDEEENKKTILLAAAFRDELTHLVGVSHKWGSAPKSALERKLEKMISTR